VHRTARREKRKPSEVAVEALQMYFSRRRIPTETPTAAELRAIRRGEEAYRKGDYITLDEYFASVASAPRRARKKVS
jgi:hypothetical protein